MPKPKKLDALAPKILFEDTHLVVISKPAGLLSQGEASGEANLVDWGREYFGRNYVGLVHRLDRGTSGLMVIAKRSKAADRLTETLKNGALVRKYMAVLGGELRAPAEWVHWLKKNEVTNTSAVVRSDAPGAKMARLHVTPKQAYRDSGSGCIYTVAEFALDTGRSHQIRVQASEMGLPLVGDEKYRGETKKIGNSVLRRPALHSYWIEFPHPMTKEIIHLEDTLPSDIEGMLEGLSPLG